MVWVWSSALALCGGGVICTCSLCGVGGVVMSVLYVCRMFPLWCRVCGCSLCGVGCVVMFPLWCRGCGHVPSVV